LEGKDSEGRGLWSHQKYLGSFLAFEISS